MKSLIWLCLFFTTLNLSAQKAEKDIYLPQANTEFAEKNYTDAEANYRISQSKFPKKAAAAYNLGNTIYRINQPSEARNAYVTAINNAKTYTEKHRAYHNLGNVFMTEKNYKEAVDAYKQALINNPADEQTRYNYALAKKLLKENPPKEKQDKKKDDSKKPNQNEKDNQEDKSNQNKDSQNNKNRDKKDDPSQNKKPRPEQGNGISKQRRENLLDAVNNEERKVQSKVNKRKANGKPVQNEKDW